RGRLARPVGSEHGDHRARRHREVDPVEDLDAAVGGADPAQLEQGLLAGGVDRGHPSPPPEVAASGVVPRYAARTASFERTSSGAPLAMIWPKSSTESSSQTRITSATSCSTRRMPSPFCARVTS